MHNKGAEDNRLRAWSSTRAFLLVCLVGGVITVAGWHTAGTVSLWQWYLAVATSVMLTTLALFYRRMPEWLCATTFLTTASVNLFASAVSNVTLAHSGVYFEGFLGYKLMAIAVAIIAPFPVWVGFLVIGVCAVGPVVQYWFLAPELRAAFPIQEPWTTLVYATVAFLVLRYRLRGLRLEHDMARIKAEKKSVDDMARVFLAMRDLTNTPLQSLEMTSKLLKSENIGQREASVHLDSSLVRLREMSKVLEFYEHDLDWSSTAASFDAVVDLEKKLSQMRTEIQQRR